jgi:hypothetical protein
LKGLFKHFSLALGFLQFILAADRTPYLYADEVTFARTT